ncbi:MAG TPA: flagellar hook-length control protein FliK [bacterium]|nr:flagellar hook-length control protein FliK [bacterium]
MAIGMVSAKKNLPEYTNLTNLVFDFNAQTNQILNFAEVLKKHQIYSDNLMKSNIVKENSLENSMINNEGQAAQFILNENGNNMTDNNMQINSTATNTESKININNEFDSKKVSMQENNSSLDNKVENKVLSEKVVSVNKESTKEANKETTKVNTENNKTETMNNQERPVETKQVLKKGNEPTESKIEFSENLKARLANVGINVDALKNLISKLKQDNDLKSVNFLLERLNLLSANLKARLANVGINVDALKNLISKLKQDNDLKSVNFLLERLNLLSAERNEQKANLMIMQIKKVINANFSKMNMQENIQNNEILNNKNSNSNNNIIIEDLRTAANKNKTVKQNQQTNSEVELNKSTSQRVIAFEEYAEYISAKKSIKQLYRNEEANDKAVKVNLSAKSENKKQVSSAIKDAVNNNDMKEMNKSAELLLVSKKASSATLESKGEIKAEVLKTETAIKITSSENANNSQNSSNNLFNNNFSKNSENAALAKNNQNNLQQVYKQNLETLKNMESFKELVKTAKILLKNESTEMQLKLTPKELGTLDIQVSANEDGQITAKIITTTNEAKSAIENNLQDLKESFKEQGLNIESFEVSVRQEQAELGERAAASKNNKKSKIFNDAIRTEEISETKTIIRPYEPEWFGSTISYIA